MNMNDRMKWRLERISKRITITEIARHINKSISYICQHENDRNTLIHEHYQSYKNYILSHDNNK